GSLRPAGPIADVETSFMQNHAGGSFKITLPSPVLIAEAAFASDVGEEAYAARAVLIADAATILAREAAQLAADGVPYIQVDAPTYASWADPKVAGPIDGAGADRDDLMSVAIAADNRVLEAARAGGAITAVHCCRAGWMERRLVEDGFDPVAEKLFTRLRCD